MSEPIKGKNPKAYDVLNSNRIARSFWTLNDEMRPVYNVTFVREIDATSMGNLRTTVQKTTGIKPSYTTLVVKAAAIALKEFPTANRAILGLSFFKRLVQFNSIDITVAVERNVPGAEAVVLADTIYNIPTKSLEDITKELHELTEADFDSNPRWRLFYSLLSRLPVFITKWLIRLPRYFPGMWTKHRGCACFVNSPAKYGIDFIVADMLWPLTVSFGWIKERPLVVNGELTVRKTMPLIIIFDRRIMAGAPAARFFNRLAEILENAEKELVSH
ncbi:MAG: dehydrogenase catalytic domain-containing [Geobacteraceae bacterium]|nr:MAG: dehydrogenase catalytic domain-containing [Geobacteraceae bacterium]